MGRARVAVFLSIAVAHGWAFDSLAAAEAPASRLPDRVAIEVSAGCDKPPFDVGAFVALLDIELRQEGSTVAQGRDEATMKLPRLSIVAEPCDPATREVTASIWNPATQKTARRSVALGDTPLPIRSRLLALAATELLRSSWADLSLAPSPAPEASPIVPAVEPPRIETRSSPATLPEPARRPVNAWVAFDLRELLGNATLAGARAGASIRLSRSLPLLLTLDGGALYGRGSDPLGSVDMIGATGGLGVAVEGSLRRTRLEVGPKVELGSVWGAGHALDSRDHESSTAAFIASGAVQATLRAPLGGNAWLLVGAEGGAVLEGFRFLADTRTVVAFAGPMLGLRLGMALDL